MTILGGKAGWSPASRPFLEAWHALLEEPLSPLADDLPGGIEAGSDLVVVQAVSGIEGDLGADDIAIL
jgi:hypothetical protein